MSRLGHLATMSCAGVAQLMCSAGAAVVAARALGPGERGVMVLGVTLGGLCALVGACGTGSALRRRLCLERGDTTAVLSAFTRCSAAGAVAAALLGVAVTAGSATFIDSRMAAPWFLVAVGCFTAVQLVIGQVVDAWYAAGRFRRGAATAAVTGAGGLGGVLLASFSPSATTLLLAQVAGTAAAAVAEVVALRRGGLLQWGPGDQVAALLRLGAPTLGLSIGLVVVLRADRYVLGVTAGTAAVGIYSVAATLSEVPRILPAAIGQLCLRDVALGHGRNMADSVLFGLGTTAVAGPLVALVAWPLVVPVFGTEFVAARELLVVLVAAELCFAPWAVASRGLVGGGWTAAAGWLGAASAVAAVACYTVTGTLAGATGVAAGSVFLYAAMSAASWTMLRHRLSARTPAQLGGR
ncbi:oligosaccharide flippase family protein [Lentzea tibetensis]|uniref:Oligosaccharide flippase family protein n=1 Tax=Lentzea tibetensis TaxID=2591470 RepID=A0A563EXH6_9PSEU|nr:oligosaccharide flippase family protein [Lentzea tibetensis]TWP52406.1 oligosaccharide flippase family protein [Lentzea tibetensis]